MVGYENESPGEDTGAGIRWEIVSVQDVRGELAGKGRRGW